VGGRRDDESERRARVEYEEHLKDREEEYQETKRMLLEAGDRERLGEFSREFAESGGGRIGRRARTGAGERLVSTCR
jgi:hypothetical protein